MQRWLARASWEVLYLALITVALDLLPVGFRALIGLVGVVYLITLRIGPREKTLAAVSILASLCLVNGAASYFMESTYYREHERLKKSAGRGFKRYAPNQEVVVEHGHGDLLALGFRHPRIQKIKEERRIVFRSDAHGYRDYGLGSDVRVVLVGDSFVAGNSNTQEHTLTQILLDRGVRAYNLGHNGDIGEYLRSLANARREIGLRAPAILFPFEGNDFAQIDYCVDPESGIGRVRDWHRALKELHVARFLAAVVGQVMAVLRREGGESSVRIVDAAPGGPAIGFLEEYRVAAARRDYDPACLERLIAPLRAEFAGIVFIPEKSRVYSFLLPEAPPELRGASVYAVKLGAIAAKLGIPFVDLTEPLRARARELLPVGKFVYWRDDTHWNIEGMRVAAEAVLPLIP